MRSVNGHKSTFEPNEDFDKHIAANLHKILPTNPKTTKDTTRYHLLETIINKYSIAPGHEWSSQ